MRHTTVQQTDVPQSPIEVIQIPVVASLDTIAATALLQLYGEALFPGIATAEITHAIPDFSELIFEEHLLQKRFRLDLVRDNARPDSSYTHRIITMLELQEHAVLTELEYWIERSVHGEHAMPAWMMQLSAENSTTEERIQLLHAYIQAHEGSFTECATEWSAQTTAIQQVAQTANGYAPVVLVHSDNEYMSRYLHYCVDTPADIVIQRFSSKQVRVTVRSGASISMEDPARIITTEEARAQNREDEGFTFSMHGVAPGAPEWFYDRGSESLYNIDENGVLSPTVLSDQQLIDYVIVGLSNDIWDPECPPVGCRGGGCPFYSYALKRCRTRALTHVEDILEDKWQEKKDRKNTGNTSRNKKRNKRQQSGKNQTSGNKS